MATLEIARSHQAEVEVDADTPPAPRPSPAEPLTIVHVITRLLLSGAEENTMTTCLHQADCGHHVYLLHGPDPDPSWERRFGDRMTFIGMDHLVHPLSPLADMRALADFRRIYRALRPDIVHTHGSKAGIVGRLAAALSGVPFVVHSVHIAPFLAVSRGQRLVYLAAERLCGRFSHLFIAVSRGMQQAFVDEGIGRGVPIPVIHSGMPVDRFIAASPPADWRERIGGWSRPERPQFILKVASFEPRKRQVPLVRALADGLRARPDLCLLLAGDGPERQRCQDEVRALGLSEQVRFLGHDPRPWELVALADVAVHAAEREGLPRTAIQAIAGGKPLVVSWLPGIEEIVEHDVNGIVTDPDDLGDLALQLFELLDTPARLEALKKAAAATDVSSWAEHKMGLRIDAAYADARRPARLRSPITAVEFFGLPGAGKTTIARELRLLLRCQRGDVNSSAEVMGDDLPLWRRSLHRLALIAQAFAFRPWLPLAAARGLTPGAASLRDKAKTRWNFVSVLAMQARTNRRSILVYDQGLAQALWTARVQHGPEAAPAGNRGDWQRRWLEGTLFVHVEAPPSTARQRLATRARATSRFQRADSQDDHALWDQGRQAVDRIDRELREALLAAGKTGRLLRIDAGTTSARNAARIIAEELHRLERSSAFSG